MSKVMGLVLAFAALTMSSQALAQGRPTVASMTELVRSEDPAEVAQGIEQVTEWLTRPRPAARRLVRPIAERIEAGLSLPVLKQAIAALGATARAEAGPVLLRMTRHRDAEVRKLAIEAAIAVEAPGLGEALVVALDDQVPAVRHAAALGLSTKGDASAIAPLRQAFEREADPSYATAIAALVPEAELEQFTGLIGSAPIPSIAGGVQTLLGRSRIASEKRLEIVTQLGAMNTEEVRTLLRETAASLEGRRNAEVKAACLEAAGPAPATAESPAPTTDEEDAS